MPRKPLCPGSGSSERDSRAAGTTARGTVQKHLLRELAARRLSFRALDRAPRRAFIGNTKPADGFFEVASGGQRYLDPGLEAEPGRNDSFTAKSASGVFFAKADANVGWLSGTIEPRGLAFGYFAADVTAQHSPISPKTERAHHGLERDARPGEELRSECFSEFIEEWTGEPIGFAHGFESRQAEENVDIKHAERQHSVRIVMASFQGKKKKEAGVPRQ